MRGAVAAGHPLTAQAGARALMEGGNAVDACVAAAFAGAVTESPLTSPGAGGFMLVHRAADGATRLADFFVAAPGLGQRAARHGEMQVVDVGFGETTTQPFRIGPASCAVPGAVAGLETAHRAFGSLPWRELLAPAIELAQGGVELTRPQAHLHALLDPILRAAPEGRRIYSRPNGERLVAGDTLRLPELADTLEAIASRGAAAVYRGGRAKAIVATVREGRQEQADARGGSFSRDLHRGGLAARLLEPANVRSARARVARRLKRAHAGELASVGGTTHVSAIDAEGNAASVSTSTGSGSGVVVPGTGIYMNNMLGEYDLVAGRTIPPGRRLTSMMAPSIALDAGGRPRLVVGSAGSARLRGAIMQIVVNVLEHELGVADAISEPRVHLDGTHLHCEGGHGDTELARLERLGYDVVRWRRRNLFFGGAAAVETCSDGTLAAAGDPRRG